MVRVNCNTFRNFIKAVTPLGNEVIMDFQPDRIEVVGVDGSNAMGAIVSIGIATGFIGKMGMSLPTIINMLPKGIDEVDIVFDRETVITAPGYRSKIVAINELSCARIPKDGLPGPEAGVITVVPQQVYERLQSLKAAFDKSQSFWIRLDPAEPLLVSFTDEDSVIGSIKSSVPTPTPITKKGEHCYSYDLVMLPLNAVRISAPLIDIQFRENPKDKSISLMFFRGATNDPVPIVFSYMFAPRVEDSP